MSDVLSRQNSCRVHGPIIFVWNGRVASFLLNKEVLSLEVCFSLSWRVFPEAILDFPTLLNRCLAAGPRRLR